MMLDRIDLIRAERTNLRAQGVMTPHILLIEDNLSDIELIQTAFEEADLLAKFTVIRDGEEAINHIIQLAAAGTPIPDLIILDLNLPRASGHDVLAEIRKNNAFSSMPVLVLSTSNHPLDRKRCFAAGATDYFVKPPHFEDLLALVNVISQRFLKISS